MTTTNVISALARDNYTNTRKNPLIIFADRLPVNPYCTDNLKQGIRPLSSAIAKDKRYIQPNGATHKYWLLFDIDRHDAIEHWKNADAPPPSIIVYNKDNGRGHYLYCLETAIRTASNGSLKALQYASAIEYTLKKRLGADMGYCGLVCKNPLSDHFYTWIGEQTPYDLDWLASYFDKLENPPRKRTDSESITGLGRNCLLFEDCRSWAYRAIRDYWQPNYYDKWLTAVEDYLIELNSIECNPPLPYSEVKAIAKSITKWTHRHFTPNGFSKVQADRGRKGGKISKRGASDIKATLLPRVKQMKTEGYSNRAIADDLEIGAATVSRWLKESK